MGLFGFGDFNKVGPGVDKNQPKKRAGVVFFEVYFRKFWDLTVANLLYVLVSLPVVTEGLGAAGLAYITRNFSREKHAFVASDFFETIRKNWKQALTVGIINLILAALIGFALWFYFAAATDAVGFIVFAFVLLLALIFLCMRYYLFMLMVTFRFTLKQLYKNSLIMAMACWKPNLLISAVLGGCYGLAVLMAVILPPAVYVTLLVLAWLLVFPAFRSYLIQFCIFPSVKTLIIDPYYEDHKGEDKDKIRSLGIEVEEDPTEEDTIFEDRGNEVRAAAEEEEKKAAWQFPTAHSEDERRRHRIGRQPSDDDDDTI